MTVKIMAALIAAFVFVAVNTSAEAKKRHHTPRQASIGWSGCTYDNTGRTICGTAIETRPMGRRPSIPSGGYETAQVTRNGVVRAGIVFIPNPPGTWRIVKSCAHRLAAYWGLGGGLDAVSTWPRVFARAHGPGVGIAVVRPGHIMGIIGGGPGAWRVADFNSGQHLNREYTVSDFGRVTFVDPRIRVASR